MADTKYLQKRGNQWHIRVPRPPKLRGMRGEFLCSLNTTDLKVAQRLRDEHPLLTLAGATAGAFHVRLR